MDSGPQAAGACLRGLAAECRRWAGHLERPTRCPLLPTAPHPTSLCALCSTASGGGHAAGPSATRTGNTGWLTTVALRALHSTFQICPVVSRGAHRSRCSSAAAGLACQAWRALSHANTISRTVACTCAHWPSQWRSECQPEAACLPPTDQHPLVSIPFSKPFFTKTNQAF